MLTQYVQVNQTEVDGFSYLLQMLACLLTLHPRVSEGWALLERTEKNEWRQEKWTVVMRAVEGEEKAFHSISATVGGMRKGGRERESA